MLKILRTSPFPQNVKNIKDVPFFLFSCLFETHALKTDVSGYAACNDVPPKAQAPHDQKREKQC